MSEQSTYSDADRQKPRVFGAFPEARSVSLRVFCVFVRVLVYCRLRENVVCFGRVDVSETFLAILRGAGLGVSEGRIFPFPGIRAVKYIHMIMMMQRDGEGSEA